MAAPSNWIWDTAPDCIVRDVDPGLPFGLDEAQNVFVPFQDCIGYFTFGPGTAYWGATGVFPEGDYELGDVVYSASTGLWVLTVLGVLVMILAFVAWVWTENRKLVDRATKLRAAAAPTPAPPMAPGEGGGSGG